MAIIYKETYDSLFKSFNIEEKAEHAYNASILGQKLLKLDEKPAEMSEYRALVSSVSRMYEMLDSKNSKYGYYISVYPYLSYFNRETLSMDNYSAYKPNRSFNEIKDVTKIPQINSVNKLLQKGMFKDAYDVIDILFKENYLLEPLKTIFIAVQKKKEVHFDIFLKKLLTVGLFVRFSDPNIACLIIGITILSNNEDVYLKDYVKFTKILVKNNNLHQVLEISHYLNNLDTKKLNDKQLKVIEILKEECKIVDDYYINVIDENILYKAAIKCYEENDISKGEFFINRLISSHSIFNPPVELIKYLAERKVFFDLPLFTDVQKEVEDFLRSYSSLYLTDDTLKTDPEKYLRAFLYLLAYRDPNKLIEKAGKKAMINLANSSIQSIMNNEFFKKQVDEFLKSIYITDANKMQILTMLVNIDNTGNMSVFGEKKLCNFKMFKFSDMPFKTIAKNIYSSCLNFLVFAIPSIEVITDLLTELIKKEIEIVEKCKTPVVNSDLPFLVWYVLDAYVSIHERDLNIVVWNRPYDISNEEKKKGIDKFFSDK